MYDLILFAYAKINIGLDVVQRLENGYHQVKMIMQTISLHDTLRFKKCREKGIFLKTDSEELADTENNLIYKAAKMLFDEWQIAGGVQIHLEKRIPIAAGMAGGSTDAAATLRGINKLYALGLSDEELMERAVSIGADVPYCIVGGTYLAEGIGEKLTKLPPMPECYVVVAKPKAGVSTKWVYENLHIEKRKEHPDIDRMIQAIEQQDLDRLGASMENVLEDVTVSRYPVIDKIKTLMMECGAQKAMMSGSGPTVFGLFQSEEGVQNAYNTLLRADEVEQLFVEKIQNSIVPVSDF